MHEEIWYPDFQAGQVVAHHDLNQLQSHLRAEATAERRQLLGFGVLDGLSSTLGEDQWVLSPGLAVDQLGRVIHVRQHHRVQLGTVPAETWGDAWSVSHRLVDGSQEGFTPVLQYRDDHVDNAHEDVDPVTRGLRVVPSFDVKMVPGRLAVDESPAFYQIQPLGIEPDHFKDLGFHWQRRREALLREYAQAGLDHHPLAILEQLRWSDTLSGEFLDAGNFCRLALINELIYTGWNWTRAHLYNQTRVTTHPAADESSHASAVTLEDAWGIPLGWLHQDESGHWKLDRRYRMGFHLGLSFMGAALGFPCQKIMRDCLHRAGAMLLASEQLACMRDHDHHRPRTVNADWLSPNHYLSGIETWMPGARWDMPRQWSELWPIDPLRGPSSAPRPVTPEMFETTNPDRSPNESFAFSPTAIEPLNQPYLYARDPSRSRIDPLKAGVLRLTGLLGANLHQVHRALEQAEFHQFHPTMADSILESDSLQPVLMVSRQTPLYILLDSQEETVTGFAVAKPDRTSGSPRPIRPDGSARISVASTSGSGRWSWRSWFEPLIRFLRKLWSWIARFWPQRPEAS